MMEINFHPSDRVLRQFAGAWFVAFSGLAATQWLMRGHVRNAATLFGAALIVGAVGLVRPRVLRWLFLAATFAAFPIGWVVSQFMLVVLFAGVITPVALVFKVRGRDRLARQRRAQQASYWKPKVTTADVRRYLRQY